MNKRNGSDRVLSGLILIIIGVLFLLYKLDIIDNINLWDIILTYWPMILIFFGIKNIFFYISQRNTQNEEER